MSEVGECPKCMWWVMVDFFREPREVPCLLCDDISPHGAVPFSELIK